jgi:hypothetical protein
MAIDTLGYTKYLEGHGVPHAEAEAHAEAVDRYLFPQLVTQGDLKLAAADLRAEISNVKAEISNVKAEIASSKVWLISSMIAVAGLALAIAKLT